MMQRRQRIVRKILAEAFGDNLEDVKLLETGCGSGQWLTELQSFGFMQENLAGIEQNLKSLETGKRRLPGADIRHGDASHLPWDDASFDVVLQATMFTSIPDSVLKKKVADEMKRVCKTDGFILWYDFIYNNPRNKDVHGVPASEVRDLFAPWHCEFHKTTLAPPIARKLVKVSWTAAELAETSLPFLRTHLTARISPR